ncbi:MAG: histidine kinase, partial [Ilumatobacteraceae bacterium]
QSRRRLIEASDRERRALERDLHDHAQQRLVSIIIGLRMQMSAPGADEIALRTASAEVQAALDDVRSIGRGIFPSVLAEEGLAVALEELALGTGSLDIARLPECRVDPLVEATAYLIAEACSLVPAARGVRLAVDTTDRTLTLSADGVHSAAGAFESLAARTVALGGMWTCRPGAVEVVLPCGF